nr:uncharacterized protein LOC113718221 [Coffea arabica]
MERRRKSVIHRIRMTNSEWVDDESSICNDAVSFFQELFTEEVGRSSSDMLEIIPRIIMDQDNILLTEVPSLHEVKEIIFSMDGDSVAGSDGFTGKFFMTTWEVVAEDVHRAIMSFFCGVMLPRSVTATEIVLLPKGFSSYYLTATESGVVPGRQMVDNFLLAQELLSDIKKSNWGGNVILKLDMMKAYDRVSWIFLTQVLRRFGFSKVWIDMIWRLISNVRFSIIVNGLPHGFFKPTQGLRQEDPILPALFVIGVEVFSRSLNALVKHRSFRSFKVPLGCPMVTYLAYVDDVVIFTSNLKASNLIMEASSSLVWRQNGAIKERVVFNADPSVSSGIASKGSFASLEKVMAEFLWGSRDLGPKFYWISWGDLCRPQEMGGIGIRCIAKVYDAFSIKLWWNFWQRKSLWAEFLIAKYNKWVHACLVEEVSSQSYIWRRLCSIQHLVEEHIDWILGEGSIDFWHDNWLSTGALCHQVEIFHEHRVSDFVS